MIINKLDSKIHCQNFVKNGFLKNRMTTALTKNDIADNQKVIFSLSNIDFCVFQLLTTITKYESMIYTPLSKCQRKTHLGTLNNI